MDGQGTKCRRNIAENYNRLSRVHQRYRRQTDGRETAYSERECEFTFAKNIATKPDAAAHETVQNKIDKYAKLFNPVHLVATPMNFRRGNCHKLQRTPLNLLDCSRNSSQLKNAYYDAGTNYSDQTGKWELNLACANKAGWVFAGFHALLYRTVQCLNFAQANLKIF